MLWLAGLIGLMAVGAFFFLDFGTDDTEVYAEEPGISGALERVMSQKLVPEDDEDIDLVEDEALDVVLKDSDGVWADPLEEFALSNLADVDEFEELAIAEASEGDEGDDHSTADQLDSDPEFPPDIDVMDFDVRTERLLVVWDDSLGTAPEIDMVENIDNPNMVDILAGGEIIAQVPTETGVTVADISIAPLSTAQSLGWAPA